MTDVSVGGADELPLDHAALLGRIAAKHAQLDGIAQTLIGALVGADEMVQKRVRSIVEGQGTAELARVIEKIRAGARNAAGRKLAKDWARNLARLGTERNEVLHANWIVLSNGRTVRMNLRRKNSDFAEVDVEYLRGLESRQDDAIAYGLRLAGMLKAR